MTAARLPETDLTPVLRTDFSDDDSWRELLGEVDDGWVAVQADRSHEGLSTAELLALVPEGSRYPVLVVADAETFSGEERTLLVVDVADEPGRTFRAVPDACRSAVGNLAIANLGFDDYLRSVDESGVHRITERHLRAHAELEAALQHRPALVPHQAMLALSTTARRRRSSAWRFRQMM
ncbi:DUF6924 domain-containing protein [Streptomyces sp. NBC_01497]|uniref:DUF6924 domain-containing protein n=1 Tax=Streptomyces sp. NBC_01497 TaxID=2903885 RepID=UPI002E32A187|nr:hypothetical protein [Streptomyces sp. NBC_01497]